MCSSLYLELNKLFPEKEATMLGDYFSTLTGNATASITVSKASQAMKTSSQDTYELLYRCVQGGILSMEYAARCPECDMLICRFHSSDEFPDDEFECYNCHEVITLSRDNIEVVFSLNKPFFPQGQSDGYLNHEAYQIAQIDTLQAFIDSRIPINHFLFNPTEEEYTHLDVLYSSISKPTKNTTEKGNTLERLCLYLFGLVKSLRVAGIKTDTNQIDVYARNIYNGVVPFLGERMIIECKNENKAPDNSYLLKLEGIINQINSADSKIVKIGMIVSRKRPVQTIKTLSRLYYANTGVVILTITTDEIRGLIYNRENLLELLERKHDEIVLGVLSDMKGKGLFDA